MFKSPIEWLREMIAELVEEYANMAFKWLELFMLKPTDFSDYPKIDTLYNFVFSLAASLSIVFLAFALIKALGNLLADNQSRSVTEILAKSITGFLLAASAPWLLENVLVKLNNAIVRHFLNLGLDMSNLKSYVKLGGDPSLAMVLISAFIVVLFVILAFQYIRRLGEFIVLLATSPIAAHSIVTDEFDLWSIWWRESVSVIFSQAFQVALLWVFLNQLGSGKDLEDFMIAAGLMVVIITGPKFLRQMLYSSGAGKSTVGVVGGTSKMAIYKYAAKKMVK
jgi:hypothetical protein